MTSGESGDISCKKCCTIGSDKGNWEHIVHEKELKQQGLVNARVHISHIRHNLKTEESKC
jgi:hypothetical protein